MTSFGMRHKVCLYLAAKRGNACLNVHNPIHRASCTLIKGYGGSYGGLTLVEKEPRIDDVLASGRSRVQTVQVRLEVLVHAWQDILPGQGTRSGPGFPCGRERE